MDAAFHGFAPEVFEWFAGLERDNSKAYFTATRDRYETDVRGGLQAMLDELSETFGGEVKLFRQQRDLRFAPDRSAPYKTRTYGLLHGVPGPGGRPLRAALRRRASTRARAITSSPATSSSASAPPSSTTRSGPQLAAVIAAARGAGLDVVGESLRTAPRGYPRDHPRDRAAAPQGADRRALAAGHERHRPRRGARPRRLDVARGRAAERLARRARRAVMVGAAACVPGDERDLVAAHRAVEAGWPAVQPVVGELTDWCLDGTGRWPRSWPPPWAASAPPSRTRSVRSCRQTTLRRSTVILTGVVEAMPASGVAALRRRAAPARQRVPRLRRLPSSFPSSPSSSWRASRHLVETDRTKEEGRGRDSNPRPPGPQPGALPAELRPPRVSECSPRAGQPPSSNHTSVLASRTPHSRERASTRRRP